MRTHTFKWKEKEYQEIKKLATSYPVIAIASPENFPASLFQQLRKKLKGKAVVKVTKTRVARKAFQDAKVGNEKLIQQLNRSIALIFTETNPFELYAFVKKNKGSMAAKTGAIAQDDIMIPAGDTGLPPGPALSDLKSAGLNVKMQGSTIAIMEDKIVTRKGEAVSQAVASTLTKLNIKPMKVGLSINACYEKGELFMPSVLDIDSEKVMEDFARAYRNALNLSVNAEYFTKQTMPLLISKALMNAKAVAFEANIVTPATVQEILSKANRQATALKGMVREPEQGTNK